MVQPILIEIIGRMNEMDGGFGVAGAGCGVVVG